MEPAWVWWSTGKDSAWALKVLREAADVVVERLISTVTPAFSRVAIHGTRTALLEAQAEAVGLPLETIELPYPCSNADYERAVRPIVRAAAARGATMVFGDLFLEDVRQYRLDLLAESGVSSRFPLWGRDTEELAAEMLEAGVEAYVTSLDPSRLDRALVGRRFDRELLDRLPPDVDPCGERGEFHTCVTAGPMLETSLEVEVGEIVEREGFVYADLIPVRHATA
ncbi:MAG: ATP-binding protein [Gemmatimonadetes bacterium]|nr:ATP-binding protein [Gemmatimonadota bacterium]